MLKNKNQYLQSMQTIKDFHLQLRNEVYTRYKFPFLTDIKYLTVNRQVELIVYVENFTKWEKVLVARGEKKTNFGRYYKVVLDILRSYVLPKKEKAYNSKISHYYMFEPRVYEAFSCSISLAVYEKNIFKHISSIRGIADDKMVTDISKVFRDENARGPEWITVVSLDEQYIAIVIQGITPMFWRKYQNEDSAGKVFLKNGIEILARKAIGFSLEQQGITNGEILFLEFLQADDTIFMVVLRDKKEWEKTLACWRAST